MSITLDQDIYKWLLGLDVIKMTTLSQQLPDGRVELDPSVTSYFSTGLIFSRLITKLVKNLSKTQNMTHINLSNLESIKFTPTPASLTYNWNMITDILKQLNVTVDPDIKGLVINGDLEMINELLHEIHKVHHIKTHSPNRSTGSRKGNDSYEGSESPSKTLTKKKLTSNFKPRNFETDAIDIDKVKADKDLASTSSVLEFFLVSLSKHLSLTPKQAVTLLTNGFKYLAHILAKGVKGVFEPVSYWYQDIYAHCEHLVTLIEKDKENNITLVQQACRPGLLSKNPDVVEWTCRFFSKLAFEFTNKNLISLAWDWFISEHGGMQGCLMGLKRHPALAESVISVLVQYARYDMVELFTVHLKNVCPDPTEQIQMMMALFKPLTESNFTKEEIVSSGVLDAWIESVVKHLDQDAGINVEITSAALGLLCDVWLAHPSKIEEQDHVSATILNSLKKMARDKSKPVALSTLGLMFKLLEHFAVEKNTYAAVIYKTLTFSVIENYHNLNLREFLIRNFKLLFESNQTIPIGILLDPLFKHIQGDESSSASINVFDIEFFVSMVKHPKFQESHALQLFFIVADIYLNNLAFYKESYKILVDILADYIKSEQLQEGAVRFVKASLAMFYSSEKNKKPKQKIVPAYNGKTVTAKPVPIAEAESETLKAQKRAMIIQVLKTIIELRNGYVNEKSKTFVLYTHVQLKTQLNTEHKGILELIGLFGNATELIAQFEKEIKASKGADGALNSDRPDLGVLRDSKTTEESMVVGKGDNDAYSFLRGVGAGVYKFKSPKPVKNTMSESQLRKAKPDPKVEEELGMIQREYQRKKMKKVEAEAGEREKTDKLKTKLKGQLEKRKIELGVSSKNQNNVEENIIFEEGSRALEKLLEKKHGLPEIELIKLENEEERDREAVLIFMKKYYKVLHNLFVSYSNVGFSNQDRSNFDKIADKLSTINLSELWKMLSDHNCLQYITKEELHALVRLVNTEVFDRFELKNLTFPGFKEWFMQLAFFIFSRPPKDLSHLPIFVCLETLLDIFRDATAKRGKSTLLYDDPFSTEVGEKDLHAFLNEALKQDPDYPLPEAYKKVVDKDVNYTYALPETLAIPDKYSLCYQLLDEICNKAVGVRLMEPIVNFSTITRAKLKVFDAAKIEYPPGHYLKAVHKEVKPKTLVKSESTVAQPKKRVLTLDSKQKISLELRKEVANFPYRDRALAQEVAEVLDDLLRDVEEGKIERVKEKKQILKNKVIEDKEKEKEIQAKLEAKAEQKRKLRHQEVKALVQENMTKKQEEVKPKSPEKKPDKHRAKYVAELKEKAKEIKEKREDEKKKKEEEEERKKKEIEEEKKKQFKAFNAQKVEKYQKKFEEVKGKREEEEKKLKEKEVEEKKKKLAYEKKIKEIIEKDKENQQKQRETTNRIKAMVKESAMKKIFDKHEKQLRVVFKYYLDTVHLSLGQEVYPDTMKFQGFVNFSSDLNIFPGLISLQEIKMIFNTMTATKEILPGIPPSISYDEFLESFMRIAIKSREKLDKIAQIKKRVNEAKSSEAKQAAEDELAKERAGEDEDQVKDEEENENKVDEYEEIEGTTMNTLEGLFYYLNLPEEKADIFKKLNFLKETRPKAWRDKKNYWKKDLVTENLVDVSKMASGLGTSALGLAAGEEDEE